MQVTFNKTDLENPSVRDTIIRIIGDSKHGGFMRVHGFQPKGGYGEIQDGTFCKGIKYGNAIKASKAKLNEIEASTNFEVTVTRGTWVNAAGEQSPSGRKNISKGYDTHKVVTETYDRNCNTMREALAKVRASLENPRPAKEYKELGNGVHVDPETNKLYLRALRRVSKVIVQHGDYPQKATGAVVALADAIKRDMPIGNYRQFNLDGVFEKVTFGGIELCPEDVKAKIESEDVNIPAESQEVSEEENVRT